MVIHDALLQPVSLYWTLAIFLGFFLFTDTYSKAYRFIAGAFHGIAHLGAVFFISWAVAYFLSHGQGLNFNSNSQLLIAALLIFIGGWIVGSFIMGIYLFISLNLFGRHHNEAFSSLKIADYKNFLLLNINKDGDLIIYPIGVRKVSRKLKSNNKLHDNSRVVPYNPPGTELELIENPITMTKMAKNSVKDEENERYALRKDKHIKILE